MKKMMVTVSAFFFLFIISCASDPAKAALEQEAMAMQLEGNWWQDSREFDTLEEARHYSDLLFTKIRQITKLSESKGLTGILEAVPGQRIFSPSLGKTEVYWTISASDRTEGNWIDFENDPSLDGVQFHSVVIQMVVYHKGKGIYLSFYGIEQGWRFSNNAQRKSWNDRTNIEYPIGFTENKAWAYLAE